MTTAAEVSVPNPRFPGVEPRYARDCPATGWNLDRCTCSPTYRGTAWSRKDGRLLKSPPFASATAAKNWAQDARVDLRRGVRRAPPPLTVNQLADRWVDALKAGRVRTRSGRAYKPSTVRGYEQAITDHIRPALGDLKLGEIDSDEVQALIELMLADNMRASTVRNTVTALRAMWRDPAARKAQPANPTRGLDLPAADRGRDRFATPAEAGILLAVLPRTDRPIWATAMYAGLRRGELMALRRDDVDVASGVLHVRQSYDLVEEAFIDTKSYAGRRKIPIAGVLRDLLVDALLRSEGHELIFARSDGRPFSPYTLAARANRHWNDAGCARITLHECRHTFAALMVSAMSAAGKFNAKVLQTLMGHSSITVTFDRYGHLMPGSETEAAGLLDRYLEAAAAAVRGADGTARGKSAGKTSALRGGLQRSQADDDEGQLSFDPVP